MNPKYIGLLTRVTDEPTRAILMEMLKDMEEDKKPRSPLQNLGRNLEMIAKYTKAQGGDAS